MEIHYKTDHRDLPVSAFLALAQRVWPRDYDAYFTQQALHRTLNITAWDGDNLVGCVRVLSDGYFFGTVTEILVDPDYQRQRNWKSIDGLGVGTFAHITVPGSTTGQ